MGMSNSVEGCSARPQTEPGGVHIHDSMGTGYSKVVISFNPQTKPGGTASPLIKQPAQFPLLAREFI